MNIPVSVLTDSIAHGIKKKRHFVLAFFEAFLQHRVPHHEVHFTICFKCTIKALKQHCLCVQPPLKWRAFSMLLIKM